MSVRHFSVQIDLSLSPFLSSLNSKKHKTQNDQAPYNIRETLLMSTHNISLWRNKKSIILFEKKVILSKGMSLSSGVSYTCINTFFVGPDKMGSQINIFLISPLSICCEYSLEVPHRGTSNEYPQHMFSLRIKKKIQQFVVEKFALSGAQLFSSSRYMTCEKYLLLGTRKLDLVLIIE